MLGLKSPLKSQGQALAFTGRIATWSARHRWWIVIGSAVLVVLSMFIIIAVGTDTRDDDDAPGEAGQAQELKEDRLFSGGSTAAGPSQGPIEQLVFFNPSLEVDDPIYISTVQQVVEKIEALPEVASVVTFYDTEDPTMVSDDRHALRGEVEISRGNVAEKALTILETVVAANKAAPDFEVGMVGSISVEEQADEII